MTVKTFALQGAYVDGRGAESVLWTVTPTTYLEQPGRPVLFSGFELTVTIRGVEFSSNDFDTLEPGEPEAAIAAGFTLDPLGFLEACDLSGELPCTIATGETRQVIAVRFELDLRRPAVIRIGHNPLRLSVVIGGQQFEAADWCFRDGMRLLEQSLPPGTTLVCCETCQFSDYHPVGHGILGASCHRGHKDQYLAVRTKSDYIAVPVTEQVMETYLCPEWERRSPGRGYRRD